MNHFKVLLNTIESIKKFVMFARLYDCEIDVSKGRVVVDGKSLLAMFSLDLSEPVEVTINSDDQRVICSFAEDIQKYIVY